MAQAVVATFAWVLAQAPSPLTARPSGPITRDDVDDELMLAQTILSGPERLRSGDRAAGVGRTLPWLLGLPNTSRRSPCPSGTRMAP